VQGKHTSYMILPDPCNWQGMLSPPSRVKTIRALINEIGKCVLPGHLQIWPLPVLPLSRTLEPDQAAQPASANTGGTARAAPPLAAAAAAEKRMCPRPMATALGEGSLLHRFLLTALPSSVQEEVSAINIREGVLFQS